MTTENRRAEIAALERKNQVSYLKGEIARDQAKLRDAEAKYETAIAKARTGDSMALRAAASHSSEITLADKRLTASRAALEKIEGPQTMTPRNVQASSPAPVAVVRPAAVSTNIATMPKLPPLPPAHQAYLAEVLKAEEERKAQLQCNDSWKRTVAHVNRINGFAEQAPVSSSTDPEMARAAARANQPLEQALASAAKFDQNRPDPVSALIATQVLA